MGTKLNAATISDFIKSGNEKLKMLQESSYIGKLEKLFNECTPEQFEKISKDEKASTEDLAKISKITEAYEDAQKVYDAYVEYEKGGKRGNFSDSIKGLSKGDTGTDPDIADIKINAPLCASELKHHPIKIGVAIAKQVSAYLHLVSIDGKLHLEGSTHLSSCQKVVQDVFDLAFKAKAELGLFGECVSKIKEVEKLPNSLHGNMGKGFIGLDILEHIGYAAIFDRNDVHHSLKHLVPGIHSVCGDFVEGVAKIVSPLIQEAVHSIHHHGGEL